MSFRQSGTLQGIHHQDQVLIQRCEILLQAEEFASTAGVREAGGQAWQQDQGLDVTHQLIASLPMVSLDSAAPTLSSRRRKSVNSKMKQLP